MIVINPVYRPIQTTTKRYILITGGRGSSKSFSVGTIICRLTENPGQKVLYTRYTLISAQDSIIPEFQEKLELMGVESNFHIRKTSMVNLHTGVEVLFRGIKTSAGNQTAKLKSIKGITTWILEEGEELTNENEFDTIDLSIREKKAPNRVIIIMNPTDKNHWIWKRWFENHLRYIEIDGEQIAVSCHPDVLHIHTTYLDNLPNLAPSFLDRIESIKANNYDKYKSKILGGWQEKPEGVVFENWKEGAFDESLPYCYGLDLGFYPDPLAMIRVAVDRKAKRIYLKECLYAQKLSNSQVITSVKGSLKTRLDLVVCDTNEPRLTNELAGSGINIQKAEKGNGSVTEDLKEMMDYELIVDPDSYNLKRELNSYIWNDKKASIPVDDNNHLLDAGRYGFRRLVKKRRGSVAYE